MEKIKFNHQDNSNSNRQEYTKLSIAIAIEPLSRDLEDGIIAKCDDLIHPDYRIWAITRLKEMGAQAFLDAADKARRFGRNPQKYFTRLIS